MAPPAKNQNAKAAGTSSRRNNGNQSVALQEYLRADPTFPDWVAGATKKPAEDKAREELKKFEEAWNAASKK